MAELFISAANGWLYAVRQSYDWGIDRRVIY